ncbi:MAG TPA: alpha/beta hydrolase, partial [Actinobacteria bacterium]|nr:alpha/beta hydrolase [Actinomycetota bacterium]
HGEEDIAIELSKAEALSDGLPNSRGVVPIPGAGHASNLTHPEPANAAIADFLSSLDG